MVSDPRLVFKNLFGWRTTRKIIVFCVDDYGNVRLHSKAARVRMNREGLKVNNRFDAFDTLETPDDLEALYNTLNAVKDRQDRAAVFTPFALPCNIDFEAVAETAYQAYQYELLPDTFANLPGYDSAWALWKEGIDQGLMAPQFHGREHLNLHLFEEKLARKGHDILTALKNRSYTSISVNGSNIKSYTAAFAFHDPEEVKRFPDIIESGLKAFQQVFGFTAKVFTPPAQQFPASLEPILWEYGLEAIDKPFFQKAHQGFGKYKRKINTTRYHNKTSHVTLVRNVVFEPTDDRGIDWVGYTLKQIEAAFRLRRPAIISSHRVNFCGHIDEKNREKGLGALKALLQKIVARWPDVEFLSAEQLVRAISPKYV